MRFGRPVRGEGLADHRVLRDRAPLAAVRALAPVVAHHVVVALGDLDLLGQVAEPALGVEARERLVLALPVEVDGAVDDLQAVAAHGDHALDEVRVRAAARRARAGRVGRVLDAAGVGVGAGRRLEHDDVAAVGVAEAEAHAVHEHALADLERRDHRLARDPERLDEERLDAEREAERDRHDRDELDQGSPGALLLCARHGAARPGLARGLVPGFPVGVVRLLGVLVGVEPRSASASSGAASSASAVASAIGSPRRPPLRRGSLLGRLALRRVLAPRSASASSASARASASSSSPGRGASSGGIAPAS